MRMGCPSHLYFPAFRIVFQGLAGLGGGRQPRVTRIWRCPENLRPARAERNFMTFQHFAGAAYRALTARKDGPSLYDICDPLLLCRHGGDPHLSKFYKTALGNPALRPLLRRTGLAELRHEPCLPRFREPLIPSRVPPLAPGPPRPGPASPSRCGSRCRSAIAPPITTRFSPKRC